MDTSEKQAPVTSEQPEKEAATSEGIKLPPIKTSAGVPQGTNG